MTEPAKASTKPAGGCGRSAGGSDGRAEVAARAAARARRRLVASAYGARLAHDPARGRVLGYVDHLELGEHRLARQDAKPVADVQALGAPALEVDVAGRAVLHAESRVGRRRPAAAGETGRAATATDPGRNGCRHGWAGRRRGVGVAVDAALAWALRRRRRCQGRRGVGLGAWRGWSRGCWRRSGCGGRRGASVWEPWVWAPAWVWEPEWVREPEPARASARGPAAAARRAPAAGLAAGSAITASRGLP